MIHYTYDTHLDRQRDFSANCEFRLKKSIVRTHPMACQATGCSKGDQQYSTHQILFTHLGFQQLSADSCTSTKRQTQQVRNICLAVNAFNWLEQPRLWTCLNQSMSCCTAPSEWCFCSRIGESRCAESRHSRHWRTGSNG